jgi:chemotaxis protein histidine kinase CheA
MLTRLVSKIGWDELLRCRSLVFVMEEEYRMQKEAEESNRKGSHGTKASSQLQEEIEVPARDQLLSPNGTPIPIIKISTESEREREQEEAEEEARVKAVEAEATAAAAAAAKVSEDNGDQSLEDIKLDDMSLNSDKDQDEEGAAATEKETEEIEVTQDNETTETHADDVSAHVNRKLIEKPSQAAASEDEENEEDEVELSFSFSNKRLCDRWLDNLFMVLYEDLRQYTIWRAEVQHFRSVQAPYRKSGTDWEIYGDLATRLHHREEAKDAYQRCAEQKFSAKALVRLLEIYADEGNLHRAMEAAIKLCVYHERWYHETIVSGVTVIEWLSLACLISNGKGLLTSLLIFAFCRTVPYRHCI